MNWLKNRKKIVPKKDYLTTFKDSLVGLLPLEIWKLIFTFLSYHDLNSISLVCKWWKVLSEDDVIWKALFEREFGINSIKVEDSWKKTYREYLIDDWDPKNKDKSIVLSKNNKIAYKLNIFKQLNLIEIFFLVLGRMKLGKQ